MGDFNAEKMAKMKKLIFVTSHGVELDLEEGYADRFHDAIIENISPIYRPYIIFHPFNWNVLVKERQDRTYQIEAHLGASGLRKVACEIACDLLWYRASKGKDGVYEKIHSKLEMELDMLLGTNGNESHIVLHGHSLGSQIVLDHCFETEKKIDGLVTACSPISKYSGQFPDWGHLPDKGLDFWVNFYANRDLVASDFSNHPSDQFRKIIEDVKIGSWNPLDWPILKQHTFYWKCKDAHKKIAEKLTNQLLKINEF